MRASKRRFAVALAGLLLVGSFGDLPAARADVSVSVSFFYDELSAHGYWTDSPRYGYVWQPSHVSVAWRPYSYGRWVHSDYGWTFASEEPWAWATYHYGRWVLDPYYGWIWVPGTEWAASWVAFYESTHWIGWAPLPPDVRFARYSRSYRPDPRTFCFVEKRRFLDHRVDRWLAPRDRNYALVRASSNVTHFTRRDRGYVNRSFAVDRIARVTGQRVPTRRLVDFQGRRGARARLTNDEVALFRPRVTARATHPPRALRERRVEVRERVAAERDRPPARAKVKADRPDRRPQRVREPVRQPPRPKVDRDDRRPERARPAREGRAQKVQGAPNERERGRKAAKPPRGRPRQHGGGGGPGGGL